MSKIIDWVTEAEKELLAYEVEYGPLTDKDFGPEELKELLPSDFK